MEKEVKISLIVLADSQGDANRLASAMINNACRDLGYAKSIVSYKLFTLNKDD